MSSFRIRPGISYRSFPSLAIILDIDRDRYWRVSTRVADALDRVAHGDNKPLDPSDAACLENLGLVECVHGEVPARALVDIPPPTASAIEDDAAAPSFRAREALEVAYLSIAARSIIARQPLRAVLEGIERSRQRSRIAVAADPLLLAQCFHRYRRLVPLSPLCLPDTIAFLRFAARRGCFPTLVFGVEAWPFAAHCWAQFGGVVLNDALDHARAFSSIHAL